MPEEYLQAAFEIKASCDEISRRILRWHWESKPGPHSFDALLDRIRQRQEESPAYYGHMPDVARKTSWQQLDTTLCMRVLLDPESDAAQPLDLLGNTAHPGAARRACNAVRTARNEAAHASDRASGGQAAILFDEAVECVEDAYAGTAFSEATAHSSTPKQPIHFIRAISNSIIFLLTESVAPHHKCAALQAFRLHRWQRLVPPLPTVHIPC